MVHAPTAANRREVAFRGGGAALSSEAMFDLIKKLDRSDAVIGAGTLGKDATLSEGRGSSKEGGIVPGHAYTVLAVKEVVAGISGSTVRLLPAPLRMCPPAVPACCNCRACLSWCAAAAFHELARSRFRRCAISALPLAFALPRAFAQVRLLKIRNPWGSFEWKGAWSDNAPEWGANPLVRAQLRPKVGASGADDGIFWMPWEDFVEHFNNIDVCLRTSGLDDLALDVKEEMGAVGPCVGCLCGCLKYWLACQGCWKMWCGKSAADREETIHEAEMSDR